MKKIDKQPNILKVRTMKKEPNKARAAKLSKTAKIVLPMVVYKMPRPLPSRYAE